MISALKKLLSHRHPLRIGWHFAKAFVAALVYGFPARKLTIIGITGTDGKTTTVGMVAHILSHAGIPTGALSTSFFKIKDEIEWNLTQKTSPSPFLVQKFLRRFVKAGCTHAVIEYSSHGLVQGRTHYTWPKICGITNTALEHLDYHGTMDQYRKDKSKLFSMLRGKGTKVLNIDDESYDLMKSIASEETVAYSGKRAPDEGDLRLWISDVDVDTRGSRAVLHILVSEKAECTEQLHLSIPGTFNLENALCAIGAAQASGVSISKSLEALPSFQCSPGRMEVVDEGQDFSVYVDFTVSPQAFERTLSALRQMINSGNRVLVLTGSCGGRMAEKRPIVSQICSELADVLVITDDESYGEDPHKVIEEVWAAVDESQVEAHKIFDRREAIAFILSQARKGDAVILCGLGSYPSRMTPSGPIPWNEQEIARELLREFHHSTISSETDHSKVPMTEVA